MPLIVLEGLDGSGKTTQLNRLYAALEHIGREFIALRDPGGTRLGEQLREILLDPANEVAQTAELFGYLLSRSQLVAERIVPALEQGAAVILDRLVFHRRVPVLWAGTVAADCAASHRPCQSGYCRGLRALSADIGGSRAGSPRRC